MSDNQQINEVAVDRRDETVTTQQPGYASTEQVTHDVAAERRMGTGWLNQIVLTFLGILEIGLGLRFGLKLIAANAATGFADFIYGITAPFVAPFAALVGTPTSGGTIVEVHDAHRHGRSMRWPSGSSFRSSPSCWPVQAPARSRDRCASRPPAPLPAREPSVRPRPSPASCRVAPRV